MLAELAKVNDLFVYGERVFRRGSDVVDVFCRSALRLANFGGVSPHADFIGQWAEPHRRSIKAPKGYK